jgi:photosystem II stability/assembly factor-like uncharacterized protein
MPTALRLLFVCLVPLSLAGVSYAGAPNSPTESRPIHPSALHQPINETVPWYWLNPRPTGADLFDVTFVDPDTAIAVGHGTIIRSTNAGYSWKQEACPTIGALQAVSFADPLTGVAVGDGGMIFGTTDGGVTWTPQSSGTTANLTGVGMADRFNATAIGDGGLIIRTVDGGANWTVHPTNPGLALTDIDFGGPQNGLITTLGGTVLVTTDGGETWSPRVLNSEVELQSVDMTDIRNGTVVGSGIYGYMGNIFGAIYRTRDGGVTWSEHITSFGVFIVAFADSSVGMVYGFDELDRIIMSTADAGITWKEISAVPAYQHANKSIAYGDPQSAILVGDGGQVYRLNSNGWAWDARHQSSFEETLNDVFFTSDRTGVVAGWYGIYRTGNGGSTWEDCLSGVNVLDVRFTDALHGVAVGDSVFLRTTDGGLSWTTQDMGVPLIAVSFVDEQVGFVASRSTGVVLRTMDGGSNWTPVLNGAGRQDLFFVDQSFGVCLNSGTQILLTYDLGDHWDPIAIAASGELLAVCFTDTENGVAVGRGGLIFNTTDGGLSWSSQNSGTTNNLMDVAFSDRWTGVAVGGTTVTSTTDGGQTWHPQPFTGIWSQYGFSGVDATGRVVGGKGKVLSPIRPGPPPPIHPVITQFSAAASNIHVDLSWLAQPIVDVVGYRILRTGADSALTWLPPGELLARTATSFRDTTVNEGAEYIFTLVVYLKGDVEYRSDPVPVTVATWPTISSFWAGLQPDGVRVSWQVTSEQYIGGFDLLRQCQGEDDVSTWHHKSDRQYFDGDVEIGRDYTYILAANVSYGGQVVSSPVHVTTALPLITLFEANPETQSVLLTWNVEPIDGVEGFHLYRSRSGHGDVRIPGAGYLPATTGSVEDTGLSPSVDYAYTLVLSMKIGDEYQSQPLQVSTVPFPVINRFEATSVKEQIRLDWELDTEAIVEGYRIYRYCDEEGRVTVTADTLLPPGTQSFNDTGAVRDRDYKYNLWVELTMSGEVMSSDVQANVEPIPTSYALGQNHPNPFNPTTLIPYALPERARVTLEVYDTAGRRVRVIDDGDQEPGYRTLEWDGTNDAGVAVASGVYFYRLRAGSFSATRKMVLVR